MADSFKAKPTIALLRAIAEGRADEIEALVAARANPNARTDHGWPCLVYAVSRGNEWVIEKLICGGADVNGHCLEPADKTRLLLTPEMRRIRSQPEENPVRATGWTALMEATRVRSHHLIRLLAKHGADPNAATARNHSALIEAGAIGAASIASTLVEVGARVDQPGDDGRTPLHCVMGKEFLEVMNVLLGNGANPNQADKQGITPMMRAVRFGNRDAIETLFRLGAEVNVTTRNGGSALSFAAEIGSATLVELLLDHGGDRLMRSPAGDKVIRKAKDSGSLETYKLVCCFRPGRG